MRLITDAGTPTQSANVGLGSKTASRLHVVLAISTLTLLTVISAAVTVLPTFHAPMIPSFVPIAATIWSGADLMTVFFLLSQFYVNGRLLYAVLASAYLFSSIMTLPYLYFFPGIYHPPHADPHYEQISLFLWLSWSSSFPLVIGFFTMYDHSIRCRVVNKALVGKYVLTAIGLPIVGMIALTTTVYFLRDCLPICIQNGRFTANLHYVLFPAIALNVGACTLMLLRRRRLTVLELWILVAMFSTVLACGLNWQGPSRYSLNWYTGKFEAIVTGNVVLVMLLTEVVGVYRSLAEMATIDPLTELGNRRLFEEHTGTMIESARRARTPTAMLVIDVDFFKLYNDTYGHGAGDVCLRRIAKSMQADVTRPFDLVSRYGGEEFVVLLPDTPGEGALEVAHRLRRNIEALDIPHAKYAPGHVTVSVGIGLITDAQLEDADSLFELADRALYKAKGMGRNSVAIRYRDTGIQEKPAPIEIAKLTEARAVG